MATTYDIRLAGRIVSTRDASSARHAASDYLRSIGCAPNEITPVGADAVAWRGAVYRAEPADRDGSERAASLR